MFVYLPWFNFYFLVKNFQYPWQFSIYVLEDMSIIDPVSIALYSNLQKFVNF